MQKNTTRWMWIMLAALTIGLPAARAEGPDAKGLQRSRVLTTNLDQFTLTLRFLGDAQNAFCNMTLSVPFPGKPANVFDQRAAISREQAQKIVDLLMATGMLGAMLPAEDLRDLKKPCYVLTVGAGPGSVGASIGWGPKTMQVLDAIRPVLSGHAAKAMDQVLSRLGGLRK